MSYEIVFWNQAADYDRPSYDTYQDLCGKKDLEGLEPIPVEQFLSQIKTTFQNTVDYGSALNWEGKGSFQAWWSPQYIRINCEGMSERDMNKFIQIGRSLGCQLYDPQTDLRFDGDDF